MDKSQLRKLTLEFSNGELDEDKFRRVRAKLIDDVSEGRVAIVREPAPKPVARPPPSPLSTPTNHPATIKPIYVVVGLLVLAGLIWAVYPRKPERPYPTATTPIVVPVEVKAPGPGERLVDEFLQSNRWAPVDLTQFAAAWSVLTEIEREETKASGDFDRLFQAITRELNAQQALAALDDSGGAREASIRIHRLGTTLGMAARLPDLIPTKDPVMAEPLGTDSPTTPSVGELDSGEVEVTTVVDLPVDSMALPLGEVETDSTQTPQVQEETVTTPILSPESDAERGFTIQLFALSSLDNVQAVLIDHDGVDLRVVSLPNEAAPHRILYGVYATPFGAETAYSNLPASLTQGRPKPIIKSIQTLGASQTGVGSRTIHQLGKSQQWLGAQRRDQFTLQLFAMNADDSVEQLLKKHSDLSLEVHYSNHPLSRFRILYGSYESPEEALQAFQQLPNNLTAGSGNPVVKSFAELQDTSLAGSP